jgi:CheY-like chemotaxis protein
MADTVLVVEDDPANALLVETILNRLGGFEVICSDDGDEILELVATRPISAALMDVSLKATRVRGAKVDGVELTRRIRSLPGGIGLPVILLTAHAMKGDRERLLFASGANDYVAKPIADQQALVSLVRRHIESVQDLEGSYVDG